MARRKKIKKSINYKYLLLSLAALIVLACSVYALAGRDHKTANSASSTTGDSKSNYQPPTSQEKNEVQNNKLDGTDDSQTTPPPATNSKAVISSAQQSHPGADAVIKTQLLGTGWGQCTLVLSRGSSKITKQSDVIYAPDFSTCAGFDIPASEFASSGTWSIDLTATNSSSGDQSAQTSISIIR